eukprot:gene6060-7549_t
MTIIQSISKHDKVYKVLDVFKSIHKHGCGCPCHGGIVNIGTKFDDVTKLNHIHQHQHQQQLPSSSFTSPSPLYNNSNFKNNVYYSYSTTTTNPQYTKLKLDNSYHHIQPKFDYAFDMLSSNIRFGKGVTREVGADLNNYGVKEVVIFTDHNLVALADSPVLKVCESLKHFNINFSVYDKVAIEPTDQSFKDATQFLLKMTQSGKKIDAIVAVGGGSVMDTAKAANLYSTYPTNDFLDYVNPPVGKGIPVPGPLKPLVAIPTTAGTGSETTGVAIFDLLELNAKTGIVNKHLKPILGLVDPDNTKSLPRNVAIASGFDQLCHSLESYTALPFNKRIRPQSPSTRPVYQGANPFADVWALKALELLCQNLPKVIEEDSEEARTNVMAASTIAGYGFGSAGVHLCHAMSYPVSGLVKNYVPDGYDKTHPIVPHGMSVALNSPAVFEFTGISNPERHLHAAKIMGADITNVRDEDSGRVLADQIRKLMQRLGVPNGLSDIGYTNDDIPNLVKEIEIEKARSEKDWGTLANLLKKYSKFVTPSDSPLEHVIHAERYLIDNDYTSAETSLSKAIAIDPNNQEVLAYLGIIEYERNVLVKSLQYLNRLHNPFVNPSNNDAILNPRRVELLIRAITIRAKCQEQQGSAQEALLSYQTVMDIAFRYYKNLRLIDLQTKSSLEEAIIRIALIHRYFGNISIAIKHIRSCLSSQLNLSTPAFKHALILLSELLLLNTSSGAYTSTVDATVDTLQMSKQFFIPSDDVEEALLALLHAESTIQQQQHQLLLAQQQQLPQQQLSPTQQQQLTTAQLQQQQSAASQLQQQQQQQNQLSDKDMITYDLLCTAYSRREQYYQIVELFEKSIAFKFSDPHQWIQLALSLYSAGKYKRSLFIVEECLATDPKNVTLLLLGAKICINHLNKITKGIILAKQAIANLDPTQTTQQSKAYLSMGIAYGKKSFECKSYNEKQNNQELSLVNLKKAYLLDPYDYRNSYHLALIYADIRDTPNGIKYIHESLALNPNDSSSWNLLALLLSSNKNYELAYRSCKHGLSESPSNIDLLLTKAKIELALDDAPQALITYKSIFTHLSKNSLTSNDIFDDSESLPRNRYTSGPSSIVSFDVKSTATDTKSHRSAALQSITETDNLEDSPGGKDVLKATTSSHAFVSNREVNRKVRLWLSLAEAFTQHRMFEDAASCLSQAESINPTNPDVFYQQGYLLEKQDFKLDAIANYQKALAIDASHTNTAIRMAVYHLVEDDLLMAENNLTTILRSYDPTSHLAWFQLGLVLKAKGEIERASQCFQRAIELDKTSPLIPYSTIPRYIP